MNTETPTRCDHPKGICINTPPCKPTYEELRTLVHELFSEPVWNDRPGHQGEDVKGPITTGELGRRDG